MSTEPDEELERLRKLERQHRARYERIVHALQDESAIAAARRLCDEASAAVQAYLEQRR